MRTALLVAFLLALAAVTVYATTGTLTVNGSTSGTVTIQAPAVAGTTTFQLPGSNGTSGYLLQTDGTGVTSWVNTSSAFSIPLSALGASTTTDSFDNSNYAQTWTWNSLSTQTGLTISSSSALTGGTLLSLKTTSASATSTGDVLSISDSTTGTGYGVYSSMTATANTGYAIYATNTGAGYALGATGTSYFNGYVGIGTASPVQRLEVYDANASFIDIQEGANNSVFVGSTSTAGNLISSAPSNAGTISSFTQLDIGTQSSAALDLATSGTVALTITTTQSVGIGTTAPATALQLASGQFELPLGSTSTPSITFAGETDAGIIGGGEAVEIVTNGSVRLDVYGGYNYNAQPVTGVSGSASSPSYAAQSYQNTGMCFPAADSLAFSTSGATAMTITSTGSVGIGTTSPQTGYSLTNNSGEYDTQASSTYAAVYAINTTTTGTASTGAGAALCATATGSGDALYATNTSTGYAGYFQGPVNITGSVQVGSTTASCSSSNAGAVQYTSGVLNTSGVLKSCVSAGGSTYTWIPISSGIQLISTQTVSAATSLQFTTTASTFSTSYNTLFLNCENLLSSASTVDILVRVSESSGFETGDHYTVALVFNGNNVNTTTAGDLTSITGGGSSTTIPGSYKVYIDNPASTTTYKTATGVMSFYNADEPAWNTASFASYWNADQGALNGVELAADSGTFSGTCSLYGMN